MFNYNNFISYLPEIVTVIGMGINILLSFFKDKYVNKIANFITYTTLLFGLYFLFTAQINSYTLFPHFFKILISISTLLVLILKTKKIYKLHFNIFILASTLFLMMIINSENYLNLYVNIELFSISLYFLMSMDKYKYSFSETIKYMISSTLASLFLLFGTAFLYGLTGSISFYDISNYINENQNYSLSTYIVPYIFIISGIVFKVGILPFGKWIIDIYKNIDARVVTYISVVPKLSIFVALYKIVGIMISFETTLLLILLSIFTALFGIFYGYGIKNLRGIMAASSYVNISYMLIALAVYTKISMSAMIFYWLAYIFMNIGVFAGIIILEHSNLMNRNKDFRGYFYKNPIFSIALALCILSLLGLPITSGFIAKIYLLAGILNSGIIIIPVIFIMLFIMIVSVCFYIKPLKDMFITLPYNENYVIKTKSANKIVLYVCTFITLFIGILPALFIKLCETISFYI